MLVKVPASRVELLGLLLRMWAPATDRDGSSDGFLPALRKASVQLQAPGFSHGPSCVLQASEEYLPPCMQTLPQQ